MKIVIIIITLLAFAFVSYVSLLYCYRENYNLPKNSWSFVDKVVYINLEDRKDRRKEIENELSIMPKDKVIRFNAIRDSIGHIGCSKSHIQILEMAINNRWNNVLIIEDDAMFYKYKNGYKKLEQLISNHPNFDVITLGNIRAIFDKDTGKLYEAQTTTAYIVNSHYYNILLKNFKEGLSELLKIRHLNASERLPYENKFCVDQHWKLLQKRDNWYIVNPALMIQRPSKSSIVGAKVDYTSYFNIN